MELLQKEGIIEPVLFDKCAAPIVSVLKSDCISIHLCRDFELIVDQASKIDKYPILAIEDSFARLADGRSFTKLDMSQAYQQLILDEESRKYVVINTYRGLFCYKRLLFGVSLAPGIFQRVI